MEKPCIVLSVIYKAGDRTEEKKANTTLREDVDGIAKNLERLGMETVTLVLLTLARIR